MSEMLTFFGENLRVIAILIALAVALTAFIFRRRLFDRGYRKGVARDPDKVRRENPPDDWSRSR